MSGFRGMMTLGLEQTNMNEKKPKQIQSQPGEEVKQRARSGKQNKGDETVREGAEPD